MVCAACDDDADDDSSWIVALTPGWTVTLPLGWLLPLIGAWWRPLRPLIEIVTGELMSMTNWLHCASS